jgi:hypothetical protein
MHPAFATELRPFAALCATVAIALVSPSLANAAPIPQSTGYAENLYADYSAASDAKIEFQVVQEASGPLGDLSHQRLGSIVGAPDYTIEADHHPISLTNVHFATPDAKALGAGSLYDKSGVNESVDKFDTVGYPVAEGTYRKLGIIVAIGNTLQKHQSLEMCWKAQGHCVVLDQAIPFLDSIINNQREAKALGWSVTAQALPARRTGVQPMTGTCSLASHTNDVAYWLTWAKWHAWAKDIYGITLWNEYLGAQQTGLRCNPNEHCAVEPFGYSNTSSGGGTLGYNVSCDNAFNEGNTGRTGKWISETKCAERFAGSASVQVSYKGSGSGVNLAWNTNGGVNSNGGYYLDTCGYH